MPNDIEILQKRVPLTRDALLRWEMVPNTLKAAGWYDIPRNCNGFMVTNTGDVIVEVNDQIFYPGVIGVSLGDSKSFGGNYGEIYVGKLKVAFANPTLGVQPAIEVVYKVYTNIDN